MAEPHGGLKVGVTAGIYYAARAEELNSAIKKLGYTLTRGTAAMEIPADVAHEVPYSHGREIRHMARKQAVDVCFHGDLSVPFEMPERGEWRDAQDRVRKSLRSAVYVGASYIDFHACLNIWLELITYAGRKLTMSFCDERGKFISKILKEDAKTREWFVRSKTRFYAGDILKQQEETEFSTKFEVEFDKAYRKMLNERLRGFLNQHRALIAREHGKEGIHPVTRQLIFQEADPDEIIEHIIEIAEIRSSINERLAKSLFPQLNRIFEDIRKERVKMSSEMRRAMLEDFIRKKLAKGGRWESEELRAVVGVVDGYHIMAHHLFFNRDTDPTWNNMAREYKEVLEKYKYPNVPDPSSSEITESDWLEWAWREAEEKNDREYKEFFYAVCSAKYLEGHIVEAFQWLAGEFLSKELAEAVRGEEDAKEEIAELTAISKKIVIGIENPDARDPQHAGLFFLWRPHQIYAAVKTIRGTLRKEGIDPERLSIIVDHEHIATQGVDAVNESRRYIATKPDYGELVISVHANHPHPLHPHAPLDVGDVILYELLYNLRVTGLGKKRLAYLMYERGGGDDPFKQSVEILKRMAVELEKSPPTPPRELPIEFFGVKGHTMGDIDRQMAIVRDKAYEPLKELLTMPEEEWTLLSQTAIQKGKKPETWKRAEFR